MIIMNNFTSKPIPPLTPEQIAEIEALSKMNDDDIDYSDIPPLTDEELARMKANRLRRKKLQQAS